ncbi:protein mono-ADP-ribosyltransferase TIPARP-like isoform X1 [Conger conger]|nr:protein mono-ADP-ribosyltransferase TIPARP-like isoform X1 [Conger conger]XP_061108302.1 protein mono-ADP-ribosyltransferase TIPARP-like isoform X1 [Conger conger]XP_061108303.1 protein mono-ADP-ribosyltransferase TIPARP-like isoform X1 [Conger conger]XP_061108304.1 protein mono-ADP-ribosyltransferase TIPARP-like isoform X1 [Conger conger]XP_061108305.1 protein mono-ADP-ribosyltransferase TIPARP-like isoform X1 [Conger conger]XP_061108306.1 protein mono-ADP-ribosyltransferase TIPARP-like is
MAEHPVCELPLKKRKIKAQSLESSVQESTCRQVPVSLLSASEVLLQIPPDTKATLPVWDCLNAGQADALWNVTPQCITIQITPLIPQKAQSNDQPATQPSPLSETEPSTPLEPASLPVPSIQSQSQSVLMIPPAELSQRALRAKCKRQAHFHTGASEEVCICDQFLLGHCRNGSNCEMHHTPYPFHWQLRRRDTHQWVSSSHSAQVKLENLYCDRNQDAIILQDKADVFTLQFDTMTVDDSEKYDKARRLSNSSNPETNPHFPTVWNMYWFDELMEIWEDYTNKLSMLLLENLEAGKSSCRFHIGMKEYEVDFSSMTQRNVITGFQRSIRRRPAFRSPFSLKSRLKTVVLRALTFTQVLPSLSVDPLQEFSSWYPPVWTVEPGQGSDQGFSLVAVPFGAKAYQSIHCLFHSTMSETEMEIISIQQVQNIFQWDKYRRQKEHMQSRSTAHSGSLERHLFHGTTEDFAKEICLNNFDPRVSGKNGVAYGQGSYFARDASYSDTYARASGEENCQHMFLAKVLVGNVTVGKTKFRRPPRLSPETSGFELYDTCVDRKRNPSIFVVFDSCQCYPYYLIRYREVSDTVKIFE